MKCPNCGCEFEEGIFCPECGTRVDVPVTEAAEGTVPVQPDKPVSALDHDEPKIIASNGPKNTPSSNKEVKNDKKKKGNPIIRIISVIVGIVILVVVFIAFTGGFNDEVAELTGGRMADNTVELYKDEEGVYRRVEDAEASAVGSNIATELSQYLGYPEEEIAALLGVEVNPEGAYPSLDNCNFMCADKVEMIYIDEDNEGDEKYSLFGIQLGTKESDISKILGSDFEYSEENSYDMDGYSFRWYDDVKTGGILMINCEDSKVTGVSYFSGDSLQAAANDDLAFFGLEEDDEPSGSGVEDEAYMEYVKNYLSDFNEVRAADIDSFTDAELLQIYNDLMERIKRVDKYGIGIDGMRSILSTSELQIMSEQTAESLYDNEVLDLYEQLCEHENDTDGTWFAEMRELYGLSSGDYILPDSDSRYLSASDLSGLTKDELRIARNEIYARHGRIFDSADLNEYFNSKSWYNGTIPAAQFSENVLNDYEKKNAELIKSVENGGGASSSGFDGSSIYGTYTRHDSNRGIDYNVEIGFYTDSAYDFIHFSTPYHSGDNIYTGRLDQLDGNVYQATDSGEFLRVTFLSNGDISVEIIKDNGGILDQLVGTYKVVSKTDLSHVG